MNCHYLLQSDPVILKCSIPSIFKDFKDFKVSQIYKSTILTDIIRTFVVILNPCGCHRF